MKNDQTSVLLTHAHSSYNAGDLALVEMAEMLVRDAFGEVQITILANWPDEPYFTCTGGPRVLATPWSLARTSQGTSFISQLLETVRGYWRVHTALQGKNLIQADGWNQLIRSYQSADVVVGVSGNQFYSTGRFGWPFPLTAMQAELTYLFAKPYYILPQSIGPLRRGWERQMLRSVYRNARGIFLRDAASLRLAHAIGLPADRTRYAPDPAFAYPPASLADARRVLVENGWDSSLPSIGVTLIAPQGHSLDAEKVLHYYHGMANLLQRIYREMKVQVVLFAQVTGPTRQEDDRLAIEEVCRQAGDVASHFITIHSVLTPALLKACYGCMNFLIGTRLHSGIFAMGMHVPVLLVGYLSKTRGMMESLGLADWVIDLENANEAVLWENLQKGWAERAARSKKLAEIIPDLKESISQIADWIRLDYARIAD